MQSQRKRMKENLLESYTIARKLGSRTLVSNERGGYCIALEYGAMRRDWCGALCVRLAGASFDQIT